MQTTQEITSNLRNLRYYSDQIAKLARQQLNLDFKRGHEVGVNANVGTIRFDCLGAIDSACKWINTYCDNIDANLTVAIRYDKELHSEETE